MKSDQPLVNSNYLLKKFSGKGGWTYAEIPEIAQNPDNPFGWVKVRGFIDNYELRNYKLMPMGNGKLFLPVKAQIRKKIKKEAGDLVEIILHLDHSEIELPKLIQECFENEAPELLDQFKSLTEGERKTYIDRIMGAKKEETQVERIAEMMRELEQK